MTRLKADLTLLMVSMIWGTTFILVKNELVYLGPMALIFWRFLIATFVLAPFLLKSALRASKFTWMIGGFVGIFLGLGYLFQTYGMQFTNTSKAGFLTATYVAIVPLLSFLIFKNLPSLRSLIGVVLVSGGMALLCLNQRYEFQPGDLLLLGCAFWFSSQVVFIGHFTQGKWKLDPLALAWIQVAVATGVAAVGTGWWEDFRVDFPLKTWGVITFLGVVATALAFFAQTYAQKYTSSTHAALMFMGEPVFAALIGWGWADEVLTLRQWAGCATILVGMWIAEVGLTPVFYFSQQVYRRLPRLGRG